MTTETLTPEQEGQKVWDEVKIERETGESPKPAVEPAKVEEDVKPEVVATPDLYSELRTLVEKIDHRVSSAEGRIGSQQKALQDMLEAAGRQAASQVKEAPTRTAVKEAMANPQQWESLKADFPEWANATESLLDARLSEVYDPAAIQAIVSEQVKGQTEAVRGEIIDSALDAVFPGWKDEVNTEAFGTWLNSQDADTKALAESSKVGDAAKMLRKYEASKAPSVTAAITQQRQSKLDAAASAPHKTVGKTPGPKAFEDMTDAEKWDHELKQRNKRKSQL